jgi:hypothetical protein
VGSDTGSLPTPSQTEGRSTDPEEIVHQLQEREARAEETIATSEQANREAQGALREWSSFMRDLFRKDRGSRNGERYFPEADYIQGKDS